MTFEEYQNAATKVPIALRNNRDRVDLPILGLQEEASKLGRLFSAAFDSGTLKLTPDQSSEVKNRMADVLWCVTRLCGEAGKAAERKRLVELPFEEKLTLLEKMRDRGLLIKNSSNGRERETAAGSRRGR